MLNAIHNPALLIRRDANVHARPQHQNSIRMANVERFAARQMNPQRHEWLGTKQFL
jgi:hypothetical protein